MSPVTPDDVRMIVPLIDVAASRLSAAIAPLTAEVRRLADLVDGLAAAQAVAEAPVDAVPTGCPHPIEHRQACGSPGHDGDFFCSACRAVVEG